MNLLKLGAMICLAAAIAAESRSAQAQAFDNAAVMKLTSAGLGEDAIIAKIRSLPCDYDLGTEQLISLKKVGVSDHVITAMVDRCAGASRAQGVNSSSDPTAAHRPGIYLDTQATAGRGLLMLRPTLTTGMKVTGNGSILFPYQAKLTVPQPAAQLKVATRKPVFWFYFDTADQKVGSFGTVSTTAAQSPDEFSLVRFREGDGGRQFSVGKIKAFTGRVGVDPKVAIRFTTTEVRDGAFKVELPADLETGEYGFVLPGERDKYRIYDFSVGAPVN